MRVKHILMSVAIVFLFAAAFAPGPSFAPAALAAPADSDGDGLPDAWETLYFGNLAQNERGDYDSDGYSNLAEYNNGTNPAVAETLPPYISTIQWTAVGPGGGGAQYNPAISPTDPNLMYGFCDMGGVYRSLDAGRHWTMYTFNQAQMPVTYSPYHCNPKFHPTNGDICYIGTREGLKRTTDGGDNWSFISQGDVPTAIAVKRSAPATVIYGNSASRIYLSANSGDTFGELASWKTSVNRVPIDIFIDPNSAAGALTIIVATNNGIYKSTDNGGTWNAANFGLPTLSIIDFDGGMKGGNLVLFATVSGGNNGVYRSMDLGANWVRRSLGINIAAGALTEIGVCEGNADVAYVTTKENSGPTIYKTTDGGDNWTMVLTDPGAGNFPAGVTVARDWMTLGLGWAWGEEAHEIGVCGSNPNYVAFSEDGRTFRSDDGGQSWFCCNNHETSTGSNWWQSVGFETTTNYRTHFAPWNTDYAYITYTDIGFFRSQDHAQSWRIAVSGSPYRNTFYDIAFDPTTAGKMWAVSSNNHDLPHEKMLRQAGFSTFTGTVLRSTNYGATWTDLGSPVGSPNNGAVTSLVVDPTSAAGSRTIYAAVMGKGVYKSTNDGVSWTAKNTGLGMPSNMNAWQLRRMSDGTLYCALTEAMNTSIQRFPGALFKSTDGGDSWTKVNTGQQLGYICGFDVDPSNQNNIYVANFQSGGDGLYGLWKTTNGGTTWTRTLAQGDTYGADIDPALNTRVYATIEQGENWWPSGGVFISENSGTTWTKLPGFPFERYGPNYVSFDPDDTQIIYVTTFGGGVFKSTVLHAAAPAASFTATPDSGQFPLHVVFDSSASTGDITTWNWSFGDGEYSHAANPSHTFAGEGIYTVTLKVEGRNGVSTTTRTVEAINVDSDGDGLPDWWELEYFGDLDETAAGDPDGDGITNIDEYNNGTDPSQEDTAGPAVSGLATVPTVIREGLDRQLTLTAIGNDKFTGNSRIAAAEYFVNVLGAAGTGTPMAPVDGVFDEAIEPLRASVSTGSWTMGTVTLYVRAMDALDHWGDANSVTVEVVDGTPPAAVTNLSVESAMQFEPVASQSWETLGTLTPEEEELTIDLGSSLTVGAVGLTPTSQLPLFPMTFTISGSPDNADWTVLAKAVNFKAKAGHSLWLNEPAEYQYIKITATGRFNRADQRYYVRMADVTVYQTTDSNRIRATWTATADDGNAASSGAAAEYDIRYGAVPITPAGFASAAQAADGVPVPGVKGTAEEADFSIGSLAGTVYVALKSADEVPNWSAMSNVASTEIHVTGLRSVAPADEISMAPDPLIQFTYVRGVDIKPAVIAFSDRPDFPSKPIKSGGITSKTMRFPLKPLLSWWKPSLGQWKTVKALANNSGTLYWRLEGRNRAYVSIAGPTRSLLFDAGTLSDLTVMNSHDLAGDEALWPAVVGAPLFSWTDSTVRMRYYYVDVSTDVTIPVNDKKKIVVLGGSGALGGPYRATTGEWKKIRKLAATSGGALYWRVRVKDADKVFTYASAVQPLFIDPGVWVLDAVDMNDANPYFNWTHTAEGYAGYRLQFCADDLFENEPGNVLIVPVRTLTDSEYILSTAEKAAVIKFAAKKGVATLYWRVRAEDAEKAFITFSDSDTVGMP